MKTLVVAATMEEISTLYSHFNLSHDTFTIHSEFDILVTGVGMTATAFALGRYLSPEYNQVLNLGIAGSFNRGIPLGSLVQVTEDTFSELGAEDQTEFISIDSLGFGKSQYENKGPNHPKIADLPKVSAITVNTVHGKAETIIGILNRLNPAVESMEGAAVFFACAQFNLPCIQVRSISNYVDVRNKNNWQIGPAIKNLNAWAIDFLTKA